MSAQLATVENFPKPAAEQAYLSGIDIITPDRREEATSKLSRGLRMAVQFLDRSKRGTMTLILPNNQAFIFGGAEPGHNAVLKLKDIKVPGKVLLGGDLAFAECYLDGEWDSPDITAIMDWWMSNEDTLLSPFYGQSWVHFFRRIWHFLQANTKRQAKRNIAYHYDIGNSFYAEWLDASMTYSSAIYTHERQSLEEAQYNKYRHLAGLLQIQPGQEVLEIGCGWGGMAEFLAKNYACNVTAITNSQEHAEFARKRAWKAGLGDRVKILMRDYREIEQKFDRVVSIEMFEAVGEKYWPVFFDKLYSVLKPEGRAVMQLITIHDDRFENYKRCPDFIQRYVFPGGMLPSPSILAKLIDEAGFTMAANNGYGLHYARTLHEWRNRFDAAWGKIERMGFDERFQRMWRYYLGYCEAGFKIDTIDVRQIALIRGA
ncbi:MAG: class I SAM-dependent methyltransferase [Dongiaceae bacterium]